MRGITWPLVLLLCLSVLRSLAYALPYQPWVEDTDENQLADALKVIERERRRLADSDYPDPAPKNTGDYWDGVDEAALEASEKEEQDERDKAFLTRLLLGDEDIRGDEEIANYSPISDSRQLESKRSDSRYKVYKTPDDLKELENILEPSDDEKRFERKRNSEHKKRTLPYELGGPAEEKKSLPYQLGGLKENDKKRTVPYELGGPPKSKDDKKAVKKDSEKRDDSKREYDPSQNPALDPSAKKKSSNEPGSLSRDEVKSLLSDVSSEETTKAVPVSKEELEDVLEGDGDDADDVPVDLDKPDESWRMKPAQEVELGVPENQDWPQESSMNKEWLSNQYASDGSLNIVPSKRKRSGGDVVEGEEDEVIEEPRSDQFVKKLLQLEDDENTNLANALNLATLAQVERSDKYIPKEVEYLKKAIEDEEALQSVEDALSAAVAPSSDTESEDVANGDIPQERKRSDSNEVAENENLKQYMAELLRNYLMRTETASKGTSIENPIFKDSSGVWYNKPVDFYKEGITSEDEKQLNPFLRELMEKYRKGELRARKRADSYTGGVCPAAERMTDDCKFLTDAGYELDDEALDLCNRHQVCYKCGSMWGKSNDDCDTGYLNEANRLCDKSDADCQKDAAGLYLLMLEQHAYYNMEDSPNECAAQCAMDYVYGLYRK